MTLQELKTAISELSTEDLRILESYIHDRRKLLETAKPLNVEALEQAIEAMREGLTEEDLDEIEWAMNVEYIEPLDESEWQD